MLIQRNTKVFPGHLRGVISSACASRSPVDLLPSQICPEHLSKEVPRRILVRCSNHLNCLLLKQKSSSTISPFRITEHLTLSPRERPVTLHSVTEMRERNSACHFGFQSTLYLLIMNTLNSKKIIEGMKKSIKSTLKPKKSALTYVRILWLEDKTKHFKRSKERLFQLSFRK